MSSSHATLSAAADDRKARLAKLKNLKRKQPADEVAAPESERGGSLPPPPTATTTADTELIPTTTQGEGREKDQAVVAATTTAAEQEEEEPDVARLHLSGRNYDAEAQGPRLGFETLPHLALEAEGRTLEAQAAGVEAEIRQRAAEDARDDAGVDLFKLQPRKPNWDLRRDLDAKLEVLAVRTDNAIARLVRERVAAAQKSAAAGPEMLAAPPPEGGGDGDAAGLDGVALVEGVRVREREEEEDERREREARDDSL